MVLDSKKIEYELLDISKGDENKTKMKEICPQGATVPQIVKGDVYIGVSNLRSIDSNAI